ncbi:MAG: DedA family protein [Thermoprotei archaeon]|nr:MAG: DedA family protein [Thermoprotei archaeon]
MSLTEFLVEYIVNIIGSIGYLGVFILMVLESALLPVPSEIVMPFAGFLVSEGKMDFWTASLAGAIGNLVGSYIAYWLGNRYGRKFVLNYGKYLLIDKRHLETADTLFQKHGSIMVFVGRLLPAVRTFISFPAGVSRMPLNRFTAYTFIGSLIWSIFLTYLGVILGENWGIIKEYGGWIDVTVILAIIIVIILYTSRGEAFLRKLKSFIGRGSGS